MSRTRKYCEIEIILSQSSHKDLPSRDNFTTSLLLYLRPIIAHLVTTKNAKNDLSQTHDIDRYHRNFRQLR